MNFAFNYQIDKLIDLIITLEETWFLNSKELN